MTAMARVPRLPAALLAGAWRSSRRPSPHDLVRPCRVTRRCWPDRAGFHRPHEPRARCRLSGEPQARLGSRAIWVDSTAIITNTSGGEIDRVELNTIAARLGASASGRSRSTGSLSGDGHRADHRGAACGILPVGGVGPDPRSLLRSAAGRSGGLALVGSRGRTASPTSIAGCRGSAAA